MRDKRRLRVYAPGLLAGLVAALVMALAALLLRDLLGISPPPELIGDRVAALLPVDRFLDLLRRVGGYDRLKQLGIISVLLAQLVVGAAGCALYAIVADRDRDGVSGRPVAVSRRAAPAMAGAAALKGTLAAGAAGRAHARGAGDGRRRPGADRRGARHSAGRGNRVSQGQRQG